MPYVGTRHLLHLWWSEVTKWVCDRHGFVDSHIDRDVSLAESVLHHLATSRPPDSASSPHLGSKDDVTLETTAKGIGPTGSVHIRPDLWDTWADPLFEAAGHHAPSQPPTACPKAAAMIRALFHDGLLVPTQDPANGQVFVKYKSQQKAALIVNMVTELGLPCRGFTPPFRGQGWATRFGKQQQAASSKQQAVKKSLRPHRGSKPASK